MIADNLPTIGSMIRLYDEPNDKTNYRLREVKYQACPATIMEVAFQVENSTRWYFAGEKGLAWEYFASDQPRIAIGKISLKIYECRQGHSWEATEDSFSFAFYKPWKPEDEEGSDPKRAILAESGPLCPICVCESMKAQFGATEVLPKS